jgi:hypothetical protein
MSQSLFDNWDPLIWSNMPQEILSKEILPKICNNPCGFHKTNLVSKDWAMVASDGSLYNRREMCTSKQNMRVWYWYLPGIYNFAFNQGINCLDAAETLVTVVDGKMMTWERQNFKLRHVYLMRCTITKELCGPMNYLDRLLAMHDEEFGTKGANAPQDKNSGWQKYSGWNFENERDIFNRNKERRVVYQTISQQKLKPRNKVQAKVVFQLYCAETPFSLTWEQFQLANGLKEFERWEGKENKYYASFFGYEGTESGYQQTTDKITGNTIYTFPDYNWYHFKRITKQVSILDQGKLRINVSDDPETIIRTKRVIDRFNEEFPLSLPVSQ